MKRREFLRAALITVASGSGAGCVDETVVPVRETPDRTLEDGAAYFPQSIASGDPRPESVVLWARVEDPDRAEEDLDVELEVSLTEDFAELLDLAEQAAVVAEVAFDHCLKVRLAGLTPATVYYYRFVYASGDQFFVSHVGRTRTAPAEDEDATVRFAFVSCQDFIGRYYNVHAALALQEVDFFVHLGDYVYETTGDPSFQDEAGDRKVVFDDVAGALELGEQGKTFYAAKSLDNYRQLYKTYRSDTALQRVHELFAMIATWDDHEYSNDAHGAVAAYFDGAKDETDTERKKAANQAWYEYMPVDFADPEFVYDPTVAFPDDISIYRDFEFGKHLHLVMTDLRTFRADHVIPEEAFPGAVAVDQARLTAALGAVPDAAKPYVDVETYQGGVYKDALVDAAPAEGYAPALVTGKLSVAFINEVVTTLNATLPPAEQVPLIDEAAQASLERGIAYVDLSKLGLNSSVGSRYFVDKDAFDALSQVLYQETAGASEEVLGKAQKEWFLSTMTGSDRTWKVWGNEYCLTQLAVDLTTQAVPDAFKRRYYMNVDAWDGFRNERSALVAELAAIDNVVAITGDIHAFYAATPMTNDDPTRKIREFVTSSVSSKTFEEEITEQVDADPVLSSVPQAKLLASVVDTLFLDKTLKVNPQLGFANSEQNGFAIVEVGGDELVVTMHQIDQKEVRADRTSDENLMGLFTPARFKAIAGDPELYQEIEGTWRRWDPDTQEWV